LNFLCHFLKLIPLDAQWTKKLGGEQIMKEKSTHIHKPVSGGSTASRRRGEILEDAIIKAAWDELSDVGYNYLTMETIARRAKTNKAVLYRRWPNKFDLIIATLHKYIPKPSIEIPDTGDLRNDVFSLLNGMLESLQTISFQTLYGLLNEYRDKDGKTLFSLLPQVMRPQTEGKVATAMMEILKNAENRNEIVLKKISPRIVSLPFDLLRYEIIMLQAPVIDKKIAEIVDDIFMPLVKYSILTDTTGEL
jgi:AcrR family transcriptional regulator